MDRDKYEERDYTFHAVHGKLYHQFNYFNLFIYPLLASIIQNVSVV